MCYDRLLRKACHFNCSGRLVQSSLPLLLSRGHVHTIEWLLEHSQPSLQTAIVNYIAKANNPSLL